MWLSMLGLEEVLGIEVTSIALDNGRLGPKALIKNTRLVNSLDCPRPKKSIPAGKRYKFSGTSGIFPLEGRQYWQASVKLTTLDREPLRQRLRSYAELGVATRQALKAVGSLITSDDEAAFTMHVRIEQNKLIVKGVLGGKVIFWRSLECVQGKRCVEVEFGFLMDCSSRRLTIFDIFSATKLSGVFIPTSELLYPVFSVVDCPTLIDPNVEIDMKKGQELLFSPKMVDCLRETVEGPKVRNGVGWGIINALDYGQDSCRIA